MIRARTLALAFALVGSLLGRLASADDPYAKHLEAKASSVVSVKLVLKIGENEGNFDQIGTVIDPAGVVMMPNFANARGGMKVTPVSIRVVFPGDEKEYDAVLGAFDSKLGLAFIRIKDLLGKQITSVNLTEGAEAKVGDELFGVTRKDEGFDYAPFYGVAKIVGQTTKPRTMWITSGFQPLAHPLYTAEGKVAGIVIRQESVSEGRNFPSIFLLPTSALQGVVTQAIKASAKALEDAKTHEAEAKDAPPGAPAMGDAGMADTPPETPGMSDGPGMTDPAPGMDAPPAAPPAGMSDGK